jgi:hypothetical protein
MTWFLWWIALSLVITILWMTDNMDAVRDAACQNLIVWWGVVMMGFAVVLTLFYLAWLALMGLCHQLESIRRKGDLTSDELPLYIAFGFVIVLICFYNHLADRSRQGLRDEVKTLREQLEAERAKHQEV